WAAIKVKGSYLQAQFHRLRARRGAKKAIIGVAASMLSAAWHMLRNGTEWHDLGAAHFDRSDATKTANRLIRRLQQIGYKVQATPAGGETFHFRGAELGDPSYRLVEQAEALQHALQIEPNLGEAHVRLARFAGSAGDPAARRAVLARAM